MGYSTTYNDLIAELQSIVDSTNDEYVDQLPNIVARAQDQVQKDLALDIWKTVVETNFVANTPTLARSADWLKVYSLYLPASAKFLDERTTDYLRMYGGAAGVPKFWASKSDALIQITPTPTSALAVHVDCLKRLPSLAPGLQTNWFSTNVPELILLQALIGSEAFLLGQERVAEFVEMYKVALSSSLMELRGVKTKEYKPVAPAAQTGEVS